MVVLGREAVSYERGTLFMAAVLGVERLRENLADFQIKRFSEFVPESSRWTGNMSRGFFSSISGNVPSWNRLSFAATALQGYLDHKKTHPPRTLQ